MIAPLILNLVPSVPARQKMARWLGDCVYCPCCHKVSESYLPFGVPARQNARCPFCGGLERHRMLWLYLTNETLIESGPLRLLHIAPEYVLSNLLAALPNVDYISADLEPGRADLVMDITEMIFNNDSFDIIICSHVLEHIPDDRKAMTELYRVLRPDGFAIVLVPVIRRAETYEDPAVQTPEERLKHYGQSDHVRIYGEDLKDRLQSAGFSVDVIHYIDRFGSKAIKQYGLKSGETIYLCTK